jgi:hypothetical protein
VCVCVFVRVHDCVHDCMCDCVFVFVCAFVCVCRVRRAGELRGQVLFPDVGGIAYLHGLQEATPVQSSGFGVGTVIITDAAQGTVKVSLTLTGLPGEQTLAHLHQAGV